MKHEKACLHCALTSSTLIKAKQLKKAMQDFLEISQPFGSIETSLETSSIVSDVILKQVIWALL